MAKTKISEYSATPGDNTDIDGINIAEGCAPSGINNAIREMMSQLKDFQAGTLSDPFNGPHNGTVGATTPNTGVFTTLSSTGNTTIGNDAGDVVTVNGATTFVNSNPILNAGTANGVTYLNGSKVLTSGSALTFDGTNLGLGFTANSRGGVVMTTSNNSGANEQGGYQVTNGNGTGLFSGVNGASYSTGGIGNANNAVLYTIGNTDLVFGRNTSEQMRLTSTGLGIGTSSPAAKLHVQTNNSTQIYLTGEAVGAGSQRATITFNDSGANSLTISNDYVSDSNYTAFNVAGAERLRITGSGNLGLGVTPSAWTSSARSFDLYGGGSLYANASSNDLRLGCNVFINAVGGGNTYKTSNPASFYYQSGGTHYWYTAPSGTAGNAISFTQAMTLDASGNLFVSSTVANVNANALALYAQTGTLYANHANGTSSGTGFAQFNYNGSAIGTITQAGTTGVLYNITSDYRLKDIDGPVTNSGAFIDRLNPVQGSWKADGSRFIGFLAHELQEVSETVVGTGEKDGEEMQSIDYSNAELIANLVAELQSLRARVAQLEAA